MIKWEYHQQYWFRECQNFEQDSDVAIKPTSLVLGILYDIMWVSIELTNNMIYLSGFV